MLPPAPPRRDRGTAERLDRHWPRTPVPSCSHCRHDHAPSASPYPCRSSHRATAPTNRSAKPSATAYSTTHAQTNPVNRHDPGDTPYGAAFDRQNIDNGECPRVWSHDRCCQAGTGRPRRSRSRRKEPQVSGIPTISARPHPAAKGVFGTLLALAVAVVIGVFAPPSVAAPPDRPFPIDLQRTGISALQQALTSRRITAEQLVSAYLRRIEQLNTHGPGLNAVRALNRHALDDARLSDRERRERRVRGPLHGIPVLIKDNIDLAGMPTTAGAMALARSFPRTDAFLVQRLRSAGAIVLGKTNLTEFANFTTAGMPAGYSGLG